MPTAVAIQSLVASKDSGSLYAIYVIAGDLPGKDVAFLESLGTEGCEIRCILASTTRFEAFRHTQQLTQSLVSVVALLKFELPNLLREDKVLYLDGDILVREDLSALYSTDVSSYYLAACLDSTNMYIKRDAAYCMDDYFNSGIMLLNLRRMREDNVPMRLLRQKESLADVSLMDQNVLNLVMTGHVRQLPLRYNVMALNLERQKGAWSMEQLNAYYGTSYASLEEVKADAAIVHFASRDKPWKVPVGTLQEEWLECLAQLVRSHPCDASLGFLLQVNEAKVEAARQQLMDTQVAWAIPFITARLDIRVNGAKEGELSIRDVSDAHASVTSPAWLTRSGFGYVIQSRSGKLEFSLLSARDASLTMVLRGVDNRDESGKRVERWVRFVSIEVDGSERLSSPTSVWHDKPHTITCTLHKDVPTHIAVSWVPGR